MTTRQLEELGAHRSWVSWRVDNGLWRRLHPGVLVVHSGPPTWRTRARAALLHAGTGAALSHHAAAYVHGFGTAPRLIEVSIPHDRRVRPSRGIRIVRRRHMPPAFGRLRTVAREETVLDLLPTARSDDEAVGLLCTATRARVHPDAVLDALAVRGRVPRRSLVVDLLAAVEEGVESALELRYHRDVERRHRLPPSVLQARHTVGGRWIRADALYEEYGVRSELDGELAHPGGRTDSDVWRDNAVVIARGEITLRYRWRHVAGIPCATAIQVGQALAQGGWTDEPAPCCRDCAVLRT